MSTGFDSVPPPPTVIKPAETKSSLPPQVLKKIDETAQGFEGMFMSQMMSFMWQGVEGGDFSGGHAEETWRGMMIEEYGKLSAKAGNLGIADAVKAELIRAQEKVYTPPSTPTGAPS